jgi:hypothetical protein
MEHGDEDIGRWRELFRLLRFHLEEEIDNPRVLLFSDFFLLRVGDCAITRLCSQGTNPPLVPFTMVTNEVCSHSCVTH